MKLLNKYLYYLVIRVGDSSGFQRVFKKQSNEVRGFLRRQGKSYNYRYDSFVVIGVGLGNSYKCIEIDWPEILA